MPQNSEEKFNNAGGTPSTQVATVVLNTLVSVGMQYYAQSLQQSERKDAKFELDYQKKIKELGDYIQGIGKHFKAGEWKKAYEFCENASKLFSSTSQLSNLDKEQLGRVAYIAALASLYSNNPKQGIKKINEALAYFPRSPLYLITKTKLLLSVTSPDSETLAIECVHSALKEADESEAKTLLLYSCFFGSQGEKIIAMDCDKIAEQDGCAWIIKGIAHFKSSQYIYAAHNFQKAASEIGCSELDKFLLGLFISISFLFKLRQLDKGYCCSDIIDELWKLAKDKGALNLACQQLDGYSSIISAFFFEKFFDAVRLSLVLSSGERTDKDLPIADFCPDNSQQQNSVGVTDIGSIKKLVRKLHSNLFEADCYNPLLLLLKIAFSDEDIDTARAHLAYCYLHGFRVTKDEKKARSYLIPNASIRGEAELVFGIWRKKFNESLDDSIIQRQQAIAQKKQEPLSPDSRRALLYYTIRTIEQTKEDQEMTLKDCLHNLIRAVHSGGNSDILAQASLTHIFAFQEFNGVKFKFLSSDLEQLRNKEEVNRCFSMLAVADSRDNLAYCYARLLMARIYYLGRGGVNRDVGKTKEILKEIIGMGFTYAQLEEKVICIADYKEKGINAHKIFKEFTTLISELEYNSPKNTIIRLSGLVCFYSAQVYFFSPFVKKCNQEVALEFINAALESNELDAKQEKQARYLRGLLCLFDGKFDVAVGEFDKIIAKIKQISFDDYGHESSAYLKLSLRSSPLFQRGMSDESRKVIDLFGNKKITIKHTTDCLIRPHVTRFGDQALLIYKNPDNKNLIVRIGNIDTDGIKWPADEFTIVDGSNGYEKCTHGRAALYRADNKNYCIFGYASDKSIRFRSVIINGNKIERYGDWTGGHSGILPAIAVSKDGTVVEMHSHENHGNYVYYREGKFYPDSLKIEFLSSSGIYFKCNNSENFSSPSLATQDKYVIAAWHEYTNNGTYISYMTGIAENGKVSWTNSKSTFPENGFVTPSIYFHEDYTVVMFAYKEEDHCCYYIKGAFNRENQRSTFAAGESFKRFAEGTWPTGIIHKYGQGNNPKQTIHAFLDVSFWRTSKNGSPDPGMESQLHRCDLQLRSGVQG